MRAVLFDLDDTLFDHRRCARMALAGLHQAYEAFRAHPFDDFERLHATFLEQLHHRVLTGDLELEAAREERFRRLFQAAGRRAGDELVAAAAAAYRDGYRKVRQPIAGAARLLERVRARARVAIVSNNLLEEQQDKLRACALEAHVDVLVVSEEAGVSKPDPAIFEIALARLGCAPADAVMIGDSWAADIVGALAVGLRAIWFNPRGKTPPDPAAAVPELRALEPPEIALSLIFGDGAAGRAATKAGETCRS